MQDIEYPSSFAYCIPSLKNKSTLFGLNKEEKIRKIINKICEAYNVTHFDMQKRCRRGEYKIPRQCCMYILKKEIGLHLQEIANLFKPAIKDHSSVLHSIKRIQQLIDTNDVLVESLRHIIKNL